MNRLKLLLVLATMPDEAFGWVLKMLLTQTWPDGLGGFLPASRESINAAKDEALAIMEQR